MRLFGSERLMDMFNAMGVAEDEQIEHKMLSSAIEKAQKKIESNNFGIRKNLLEYDQVNERAERDHLRGETPSAGRREHARLHLLNMIDGYRGEHRWI